MDARDTLTDDLADEAAYRERATAILDELAHRARVELRSANIPLNVYFVIGPSGDAVLTCGAVADNEQCRKSRQPSARSCAAPSAWTRHNAVKSSVRCLTETMPQFENR
jgi:hypothetical protein